MATSVLLGCRAPWGLNQVAIESPITGILLPTRRVGARARGRGIPDRPVADRPVQDPAVVRTLLAHLARSGAPEPPGPNPPGWVHMCDFADACLDLPFAPLVDTPAPVPWPAGWLAVGIAAMAVTRAGMRRRAG
ncbi:MAG: hypothetical protein Q8Q58_09825 [Candidatus Rokubacteria bacterium]|nr:hypothetical protein [Candidatus Rokubacteria bacterium]